MGSSDDEALAATTYPPSQTVSGVEATIAAPATSGTGAPPVSGLEATVAPQVRGVEATLAPPISGIEPTLAPLGGARAASADHAELVGVERAHYTFDTEIARGGMGRILRARDRRLGREVAVKELLDATPDARARFEREARITARLQHPAIVNIYEAGVFADGQAFYAMKLVAGDPFDRVIAKTEPVARMALLPTVLAVADALAYAHSRHVIHRDLKPHNVLVGEFGETVVIDWGLAKDLSATGGEEVPSAPRHRTSANEGETIEGSVMGTPAYMPREQAAGDPVDARADVYAIGAILYKALSGVTPYTGKTAQDILVAVLREPPVPLDKLVPDAPEDLLTIVAKAMAREPADRYPTARELAEDLRRYQTGQLVASHRYSSWQLVRRWARRHRTVLTVAGMLLAILAVTATISVRRIIAERNEAEKQRGLAERSQQLAERKESEAVAQRRGAEKLADFLLVKLKERLEPIGKLDLLQGIGDAVVAYYETVAAGGDVGDDQLRQRADALLVLADVDSSKGDVAASVRSLEAAKRIRAGLLAKQPAHLDYGFAMAQVEERLGHQAYAQGDLAKSRAQFTRARAILSELLVKAPGSDVYRRNLPMVDRVLAVIARERGDLDEALGSAERSRAELEKLATGDPKAAEFLVSSYQTLASIQDKRGDSTAADETLRKAVELARERAKPRPVDAFWVTAVAESTGRLGRAKADRGHPADAIVWLTESRDTAEALTKLDPQNLEWLAMLGFAHADLGAAYEALARYDEAMASYRRTREIRERVRARAPDDVKAVVNLNHIHDRIAKLLIIRKDAAAAARELEIVQQLTDGLAAKYPDSPEMVRNIGIVAETRGDLELSRDAVDAAIALYRKGLKVAEELSAKDPNNADLIRDLVGSNLKLSAAYLRKSDQAALQQVSEDVIRHARRAVAIPGSDAEYLLALALTAAANTAWGGKREAQAQQYAREAVIAGERDAKAHPQDPNRVMALIEAEGVLAQILGKSAPSEARAVLARATDRLTALETEKRAPAIAGEMRKQLKGVEKSIAK